MFNLLPLLAFSSCGTGDHLTIVSYNVQNLFDSIEDGHEYATFTHSAGYTPDRYFRRLVSLAETLQSCSTRPPDLIVLQEIEGRRAVADLLHDHLRSPRYYVSAVPAEGRMGVAVLSRTPPSAVRSHQSVTAVLRPVSGAIAPVTGSGFSVVHQSRHIVEVEVDSAIGTISLFGCHWKSQSGGEEETEPMRVQEAALLRARVVSLSAAENPPRVLVVGDLNEEVEEYRQHNGRYPTALMPLSYAGTELVRASFPRSIFVTNNPARTTLGNDVVLFSPWLAADGPTTGTYYHAGRWERLDQVLFGAVPAGELSCTIAATGPEYLRDEEGKPSRYDPRTGVGYSDHLPVLITIGATHPSQ